MLRHRRRRHAIIAFVTLLMPFCLRHYAAFIFLLMLSFAAAAAAAAAFATRCFARARHCFSLYASRFCYAFLCRHTPRCLTRRVSFFVDYLLRCCFAMPCFLLRYCR